MQINGSELHMAGKNIFAQLIFDIQLFMCWKLRVFAGGAQFCLNRNL